MTAGVFPSSPASMAWYACDTYSGKISLLIRLRLANNLAPHYVRGTGTGLQIAIGNCSAFVATFTYLKKDA